MAEWARGSCPGHGLAPLAPHPRKLRANHPHPVMPLNALGAIPSRLPLELGVLAIKPRRHLVAIHCAPKPREEGERGRRGESTEAAAGRDENGSDTNGYHLYYICFHISVWIRIRTWIAFGYIYEYGLTRLRIRIMSIEYGMNRIRRMSDTNIYSDIE